MDNRPDDTKSEGAATLGYQQADTPVVKPLRLWPLTLLILIYWGWRLTARYLDMAQVVRFMTDFGSAVLLAVLFIAWWIISRRVPRKLKWPAMITLVIVGVGAKLLADGSITVAVMISFGLPLVVTAWLLALYLSKRMGKKSRRVGVIGAIALVWTGFALIRFDGISGEGAASFSWRWSQTAEQKYLASVKLQAGKTASTQTAAAPVSAGDWPAFRGPGRDGIVRGAPAISTDWNAAAPSLLWKGASGPGWSSPVIVGNRLIIHEQRGPNEAVVCRDLSTGAQIWVHEDPVRFEESLGGAGPRATPTAVGDKLYTFGAKGLLNCLELSTGQRVWSRDVLAETNAAVPMWAFASSPLVAQGVVIVWTGGPEKGLVAYQSADGVPVWTLPAGKSTYTSAQLVTLGAKEQALFISDAGLTSIDPATGKPLWDYPAAAPNSTRSVQPIAVGSNQVLISSELDIGVALLDVKADGGNWLVTKKWQSRAMKPSFNDFVLHQGHLYGFDGAVFCCVELETGKRKWREGRYGHGQVIALAAQGVLIVTAEKGEVVAIKASPEAHSELGTFQALEGKVWSHPAIANGKLVVRGDRETACFELKPQP